MSSISGNTDHASDLQSLLANLRSSSAKNSAASKDGSPAPSSGRQYTSVDANSAKSLQQDQISQQRSTSMSPAFLSSLSLNASQPPVSTGVSQSSTPAPVSDRPAPDRTANLLNLLKFSSAQPLSQALPTPILPMATQTPPGSFQPSASTHSIHGRGISASDLVASFTTKPLAPAPRENQATVSSANRQDFLLKLLNSTNTTQTANQEARTFADLPVGNGEAAIEASVQTLPDRTTAANLSTSGSESHSRPPVQNDSPIRVFGSKDNRETTPFEPQDLPPREPPPKKEPIFTYVNPFEQLAASSPRHAKVTVTNGEGNKRKPVKLLPLLDQPISRSNIDLADGELHQSVETLNALSPDHQHTPMEAPIEISAPSQNPESVAEALDQVGDRIHTEVEDALAAAEDKEVEAKMVGGTKTSPALASNILEERVGEIASGVKQELKQEEIVEAWKESVSEATNDGMKNFAVEAARTNNPDEWESAEGEESKLESYGRSVKVFQFPMKPFTHIDITLKQRSSLTFREESVTNIARLKKDYDQIDRTLATATNDFIVYGSPKAGGLKVIRQDDGEAKHIFSETHDRIFNVSISYAHPKSPSRGTQNIIATGVSGTVYWSTILKPGEDVFDADVGKKVLVFPPFPHQSDNPSTGQKAPAKKSCRNPEFFAISRGKFIYIVFPEHALGSRHLTDSTMDSESYFKERNLRINTGKGGKDFILSEDDSTIFTLDKTGRLRIWDIRDLVDEDNALATSLGPIEIKTPMLTFITAINASEKAAPSSILLVDKIRPYTKGTALRYAIIGMKQNHCLQLWDLCLGKAVQEVDFPQENEHDAICSIAYHPPSNIIVVGHPTRNSIFLVHLSAPRYNLPVLSQAELTQRIADKDHSLPRAENTAVMSGLREYSLSDIGQLRSLDLVPSSGEPTRSAEDDEDPMLFELYVMHSKGVTCFGIRKEDLGWSKDSKVLNPVNAEQEGYIDVKYIRQSPSVPPTEPLLTAENIESSSRKSVKEAGLDKTTTPSARDIASDESAGIPPKNAANNGSDKPEKRKKKRPVGVQEDPPRQGDQVAVPSLASIGPASYATAAHRAPTILSEPLCNHSREFTQPSTHKSSIGTSEFLPTAQPESNLVHAPVKSEQMNFGISADLLDKESKKIEKGLSNEVHKVLRQQLDILYQRITDDKRVQEAAGAAKQDAILRLVSSTLGDNVEKALSRIITTNIQQEVIPSVVDVASSSLRELVPEVLTQQLRQAIPPLLKLALPEAISKGVQNPEVLHFIAEQINVKVASRMDKELSMTLQKSVAPAFKSLAANVAQKSNVEIEDRLREHLRAAEIQRRDDSVKVDQLTQLVRGLSETVHAMAAAQSGFQEEILKLQQQAANQRQVDLNRPSSSQAASQPGSTAPRLTPKSPEQEELEAITNLMNEGRLEEATIQVCIDSYKY